MMLRRTVLIRLGIEKRKGDDWGGNLNQGFWKEYQAKSIIYIYHRVVVVSSQKERVRWAVHTQISNQTLYYILKERFTSYFFL